MAKVSVIGSGFAGLSGACHLASKGVEVKLYEKNEEAGGRARSFEEAGFIFDMGPSWYWMPEIMEHFFNTYGYAAADFFKLIRLDPSYQVFFTDGDCIQMPASYEGIRELFERYEVGSARKLDRFLESARYKYEVGIGDFVHRPSHSVLEYADIRILKQLFRLKLFSSVSSEIKALFRHPKLVELLEFPVLFLGAKPSKTPALYSLMNYADIKLGTWYPMGGMEQLPKAMAAVARTLGVEFCMGEEVQQITVKNGRAIGIHTLKGFHESDGILAAADYHHVDTKLIDHGNASYTQNYWDTRVMSPSALIYYLGVNKRLEGLLHHNLFFDADFKIHSEEIYDTKIWPTNPLFYVCCPSKTDPGVAPEGCENMFILIPLAAGIDDIEEKRAALFDLVMGRLEKRLGEDVRKHIIYQRSYCLSDFERDYHSFRGNAYGLANTLFQTAFLKPAIRSKKVTNLYFAGQLTVPGPGVPPTIISGQVAAAELMKCL